MKKSDRFIIEEQNSLAFGTTNMIVVDVKTGVNYLFIGSGYGGGLTALLDENGEPIISKPVSSPTSK
jgi:hypothetical protein